MVLWQVADIAIGKKKPAMPGFLAVSIVSQSSLAKK
jgi:multisubunit Na+/H+ antiporter MnhE subunit